MMYQTQNHHMNLPQNQQQMNLHQILNKIQNQKMFQTQNHQQQINLQNQNRNMQQQQPLIMTRIFFTAPAEACSLWPTFVFFGGKKFRQKKK